MIVISMILYDLVTSQHLPCSCRLMQFFLVQLNI